MVHCRRRLPRCTSHRAKRTRAGQLTRYCHSSRKVCPNSLIDQNNDDAVIRLTEKLKLHHQSQAAAATKGQQVMGMEAPESQNIEGIKSQDTTEVVLGCPFPLGKDTCQTKHKFFSHFWSVIAKIPWVWERTVSH